MTNAIDKFLTHKTSDFGGAFLTKWREQGLIVEDGAGRAIDTWMHTQCPPEPIWRHGVPKLVPRQDKDTGETNVMLWSDNLVCHEPEDVLRAQYHRNDDGSRKKPPTRCGQCILAEYVFQEVQAGRLHWLAPVFEFSGKTTFKGNLVDDKVVIHAAGIYNGFSKVEDDEEKAEMKKAGVAPAFAWRENMLAKCNYIFRVVNHHKPADGVQIAIEAQLLGDKVKSVISDRMVSRGVEDGNPLLVPYPIRWIYRDKEKQFQNKYHALAIEPRGPAAPTSAYVLTDQIRDLIVTAEPPSIDKIVSPHNQQLHRAVLEKHAVLKGIPWDRLFPKHRVGGPAIAHDAQTGTPMAVSSKATPSEVASRPKTPGPPPPAAEVKKVMTTAGVELPEADCLLCDECKKPMGANWNECPKPLGCGTKYNDPGLVDPPRPAPKQEVVPRGRSRTKAATAAEAKKPESPKADPVEPDGSAEDQGDSIPWA